jgi:hypothetical protein
MALRFNPLTALEGSFRGFPFLYSRERKPGGQRGPLHEYPDRDEPYFEGLGRKAKQYDLTIYFIGTGGDRTGTTADIQADGFEALLWGGKPGPLLLGLRRETVWARSWDRERTADKSGWVQFQVTFVEAGRNQYPASQTSWLHTLLDKAVAAATDFGNALGDALEAAGLPLEVAADLVDSANTLVGVLNVAAQLAGGGLAPSSVLAAASALTAGFAGTLPGIAGPALDTLELADSTTALLASWADAIANAGDNQTNGDLGRSIDALFTVYDQAAAIALPEVSTPTRAVELANDTAWWAAVRRLALAQAARLAARLTFSSYDDAVALRTRFADAFDAEVNQASGADGTREALADLQSTTLLAISAAGADKARLVPYQVPAPRTAVGLAQLFYPDDPDVASRAAELAARNGVVHPSFMPTQGERLSS